VGDELGGHNFKPLDLLDNDDNDDSENDDNDGGENEDDEEATHRVARPTFQDFGVPFTVKERTRYKPGTLTRARSDCFIRARTREYITSRLN